MMGSRIRRGIKKSGATDSDFELIMADISAKLIFKSRTQTTLPYFVDIRWNLSNL
jgi:hypothetical protein